MRKPPYMPPISKLTVRKFDAHRCDVDAVVPYATGISEGYSRPHGNTQLLNSAPADVGVRQFQCKSERKAKRRVSVYKIAPLRDPRWEDFLHGEPRASIFHTDAWLEALRRTYGYDSIVYTTSPPGSELRNGVVFCQIKSWLTGSRLVSLPFSDHCEALVDDPQELRTILGALEKGTEHSRAWNYIEMRPLRHHEIKTNFHESTCNYVLHRLDLAPSSSQLFGAFHKDSTQRKIRRAEREGLGYEDGRSESLLLIFYRLLTLTRRRHGVPPQPLMWFRNLIDCMGEALQIRVAFHGSRPIAAILTLRYKDTLLYKYGCSDERFHSLGGVQFLLWRSIQESKDAGLTALDFGRSDCDNEGLIRFKDRWGTIRSSLTYSRYTTSAHSPDNYKPHESQWTLRIAKRLLSHAPGKVLSMAGDALYKHIG